MTRQWQPTPMDTNALNLTDASLDARWGALHAGNHEPLPTDPQLRQAWLHYHRGEFAAAADLGCTLGGAGLVPAAFATTIYAQYVESDDTRKQGLFLEAMELCDKATSAGFSSANLHYIHAVAIGRCSQFISMTEALARGYAGKVKEAIAKCMALDPDHAEGHLTFGGWHAAVTDQAGGLMARVMFGASLDEAQTHFDEALRLAPDSVVCHLEYAHGLEVMYGKSERVRIVAALREALARQPVDAMQLLDVEKGKAYLATLGG